MKPLLVLLLLLATISLLSGRATAQEEGQPAPRLLTIEPGDTWTALALRFGVEENALRSANPHMNRHRQPAVGAAIGLPGEMPERTGRLFRPEGGGLLEVAARLRLSPWELARENVLPSPFAPLLYQALIVPGESTIRDLPPGVLSLEYSLIPAPPGQALGVRGTLAADTAELTARLDTVPVATTSESGRFLGLLGTGAFFGGGEPELLIHVDGGPVWVQPWRFADREWEYQELTLTGDAAAIDQQARDEERARLRALWTTVTPGPQWTGAFRLPLDDYLQVSANYGARRSYNGGPYLSYHEGVDFSAYGGTPVYAPAAGTVVLAERLYVRGGAVIIDHGMGVFTGFYHLSAVHALPGQAVQPGDLLGEVGTTGLSTGNHLHWDLLINGVWVDAAAWQDQATACWALEALNRPCAGAEAES